MNGDQISPLFIQQDWQTNLPGGGRSYCIRCSEKEKNRKLVTALDDLSSKHRRRETKKIYYLFENLKALISE